MRTLLLAIALTAVITQPAASRPIPTVSLKLTSLDSDSCVFTSQTKPHQKPATAVFHCQDIPSTRTFGPFEVTMTSQRWTANCDGVAFGPPHIMDIIQLIDGSGTVEEKIRKLKMYFVTHKVWMLEGQRPYTF